MRIEPAHVDQLLRARDGRLLHISDDVGGVAADLQAIDPCLKVRFAEYGQPPFFAVYWESEDGRKTDLVLTAQAHQSATGIWDGLDQRVVKRVREIADPSYDYAAEIERINRDAHRSHKQHFAEQIGEHAEQAAHAIRQDLGLRYRGRAFIPKDVP